MQQFNKGCDGIRMIMIFMDSEVSETFDEQT